MSSNASKRRQDLPPAVKNLGQSRQGFAGGAAGKGIGPNKACGHKGGIRRQGSKRG